MSYQDTESGVMALVSLESLDDMWGFAEFDKSYSWSVECHLDEQTELDDLMIRFEQSLEKYSTE